MCVAFGERKWNDKDVIRRQQLYYGDARWFTEFHSSEIPWKWKKNRPQGQEVR